jgi:hypothetical protein
VAIVSNVVVVLLPQAAGIKIGVLFEVKMKSIGPL